MNALPADSAVPADLREALAAARPRLGGLAAVVYFVESARSTNDLAAEAASHGAPDGTLVVAAGQTAGRGRRGRRWISVPGAGVYASIVLRSPSTVADAGRLSLLTLAAGVGLAEGLDRAAGLNVTLKWPNDLLVGGRKVGGILAEASTARAIESVVLGFGINLHDVPLPPELEGRATSVERERGAVVERAAVLVEALAGLAVRLDDLRRRRFDAILTRWRARSPSAQGATVRWATPAGVREGRTDGIGGDGALMVISAGERVPVLSADLEWL